MQRFLQFLLLSILLTGCQSAALSELDYDTRQDFSLWQSWQWAEPAVEFYSPEQSSDLDRERVQDVVGEQLLQWGYIPVDQQPDFLVRAWLGQEDRIERIYVQRGGFWGDPWGRYRYPGDPGWIEPQDIRYRAFTLQLDILDAKSGKLVWRASDQWAATSSNVRPQKRDAAIRKAVRRLLKRFPPS